MDCCNYVPYRHHQGYYGYYNEPLPPYHGDFYGHHNMYHDYYGNINPYYSPHQHWQGAGVFVPQDYVYNPKEARLRKAMREAANRDRSIGASPMLPRPNARRAGSAGWVTPTSASVGGGPVTSTPHGHEEPLMMSSLSQGMRGPGLDSPCFPSTMSSTSGGISGSGSEQFMPPSMGAATPAPGYAASKLHQDSPLPPPPAPTPGVHSPYMQAQRKKKTPRPDINNPEGSHRLMTQDETHSPTLNIVKRQQQIEADQKMTVGEMRNALPNYDLNEIRELRLPFHEALLVNLEDSNYVSSASFAKDLLAYQDKIRKEAGPGSSEFMKPLLKFSKEQFRILVQSLQAAEKLHMKNCLIEECNEFLKLAIYFAFSNTDDWWWLGEQLLIQSIKVSTSYSYTIGDKFEALSRYGYGTYLLDNLKEFDSAVKQFKIVRHLSAGKPWSGKNIFPEFRGTLFMQANFAIYDCMIREVKYLMSIEDYDKALIMADQARKRAAEACHRDGETRALVLKGICEMATMRLKSSINSFLRACSIQERLGSIEGLCKIRIHLAKAYLMDNCATTALSILMTLKKDAEEHNLPYYLALVYKNLGEYYLKTGECEKANPLLDKAVEMFNLCESVTKDVHTTRTLRAVSGGLQIFPKYAEIIKAAGKPGRIGQYNLKVLLNWKEERTEFWNEYDNLVSYNSCDAVLLESMSKVASSRPEILNLRFKTLSALVLT